MEFKIEDIKINSADETLDMYIDSLNLSDEEKDNIKSLIIAVKMQVVCLVKAKGLNRRSYYRAEPTTHYETECKKTQKAFDDYLLEKKGNHKDEKDSSLY